MTKTQILKLLSVTPVELARILGVTPEAIYMWSDTGPIPEKQLLRLKYELRPEAFKNKKKRRAA